MIELRRIVDYSKWQHPSGILVPTVNLTAKEVRELKDRDDILDKLEATTEAWIKINTGIYRGSIFPATKQAPSNNHLFNDQEPASFSALVDHDNAARCSSGSNTLAMWVHQLKLDPTKGWKYADRSLSLYVQLGSKPIGFKEATIYPEFFGGPVTDNASVLLDYQGDRVFALNETKRPLEFKDRLDQDVKPGDLVVVALNYGEGLDICTIKGFSDERRMVIESVITGKRDRIALEDEKTNKIMRMPMSLKDTALMLRLAR